MKVFGYLHDPNNVGMLQVNGVFAKTHGHTGSRVYTFDVSGTGFNELRFRYYGSVTQYFYLTGVVVDGYQLVDGVGLGSAYPEPTF